MTITEMTVADPQRTVEESQRKDAYDLQIDAGPWTKDLVNTQIFETTTIRITRMLVEISWRWRKTLTLLVNSRMISLPKFGKDTAIPRR